MATMLAEMTGLAMRGLVVLGRPPDFVRILADVMLFVALIAGMMTLTLTPVVLRLRRVAPPRVIVAIAVVTGLVPLAVVVAQRLG
jgi:hypothetical protein